MILPCVPQAICGYLVNKYGKESSLYPTVIPGYKIQLYPVISGNIWNIRKYPEISGNMQ